MNRVPHLHLLLLAVLMGLLPGAALRAQAPASPGAAAPPLPSDVDPVSRTRLPVPRREDLDQDSRRVLDEIFGDRQPPLRWHSPKLAKPMAEAHHYAKYGTALGPRLTEIAVLVTARETDNQFEWTQWEEHGQAGRVPPATEPAIIDIIKYCKPATGLGAKEAAIITLGRELLRQKRVSPATYATTERLFGRGGTVDLVELMALYAATGVEVTAFDVQLRPGQHPLLPDRSTIPACQR
ncbi:MAG: hypothetical protein ABUS56_13125 [Acidobacteriota bacterium]